MRGFDEVFEPFCQERQLFAQVWIVSVLTYKSAVRSVWSTAIARLGLLIVSDGQQRHVYQLNDAFSQKAFHRRRDVIVVVFAKDLCDTV